MAGFEDELLKLTDPSPIFLDPEDDINIETTARVVGRFDEGSEIQSELSNLRQKTAPLLEDIDVRYVGKRISRESFDQIYEAGDEKSEEDSEIDEDVEKFKQLIPKNVDLQESDNEQSDDDQSSEAASSTSEMDEDDDHSNSDKTSDTDAVSDDEEAEQETERDMFQKFSHIDLNEEIEKGKAIESQLGLWNRFCECRIQFQKILISSNRLPQFDTWNGFKEKGNKNYLDALEKGSVGLKSLLDSMLKMQSELHIKNPEINSFDPAADSPPAQESDEEVPSDSDSENKVTVATNVENPLNDVSKKRKQECGEYSEVLSKRFKIFVPYRNSVIKKWDDRTHVTAGKMAQKSFSAFNESALEKIDKVLQNKHPLIQKTQIKRSAYSVLGRKENENSPSPSAENKVEEQTKREEYLKCHDPEIFDDCDFYYYVLLTDIIQSKSVGMDPDVIRKRFELQKNRSKMKRKVDTKASKARKLRYDTHPKMISFMASVNIPFSEETKDDLFKRTFSQRPTIPSV